MNMGLRFWLKKFLEELHATARLPINLVQHDQIKYVEVDRQFIKEKVEDEVICMTYVHTKEQTIYIFTKGLPRHNFDDFICKLDMINIQDLT